MDDKETEKRWHRFERYKSPKHLSKRFRKIESSTLGHGHTFIVQRWQNVQVVRRQVLGWLLLVLLLISSIILQMGLMRSAYQQTSALDGGAYSEGVVGTLETLNPILANTEPELAASKLLYSGLLTHDEYGELKLDLAENWVTSEQGKIYTLTLKDNLKWQDGETLDADDAVFTFKTIKNPDAKSPYYNLWRDVNVSKVNQRTVQLELPVPFAPFAQALTIGLLSNDKFSKVAPEEFRTSVYDKQPLTNGPFVFSNLQTINRSTGRLTLHAVSNADYHLGETRLDRFQLHVYGESDDLQRAFLSGEINAATDFTAKDVASLKGKKEFVLNDVPLNNSAMAIMKTDSGILSDPAVRSAIVSGTDRKKLIADSLSGLGKTLDQPLTPSLLKRPSAPRQAAFDLAKAEESLNKQGWMRGEDGRRTKNGQPFNITLATARSGDYQKVAEELKEQWSLLGISTEVLLIEPADIQQNIIGPRAYDVLLYELSLGSDPDVYAYWHSSQANSKGLNLANLKSAKVDDSLDSARSRFEPDLRSAKYETFVSEWLKEAPAVVLYQPTMHYITNPGVSAVPREASLIDPVDRYENVQYWSLSRTNSNKTP